MSEYDTRSICVVTGPRRYFNSEGIHMVTGTKFDPSGYDQNGYNRNGFDVNGYDRNGFDANGLSTSGQIK